MASNLVKLLAAIFCLGAALSQAQEQYRALDRAAGRYWTGLVEGRYAGLEQESNEARQNGTLLEDGQPRLWAVYTGLGDYCNCYQRTPEQFAFVDAQLNAWRKVYPKSVTAEVLTGEVALARAWAIRGGGYADTVTPQAWKGFHAGLQAAEKRYSQMSPEAKADPQWYVGMLEIGLGLGWPEKQYHNLYVEGAKRHPLYYPIFRNAAQYYTAKWHGSPERLRQFIAEAATLTTNDYSDTIYTRLSWAYFDDSQFPDGADWKRVKSGFDSLIAKYPDPWNINNYAKLACMAGDYEAALKLKEKIGDHLIAAAWSDDPSAYGKCLAKARTLAPRMSN